MKMESIHYVSNFEGVVQPAAQPAAQVGGNEQENRADPISSGTVNGIRKRVRFNLVVEEKEEEEEDIRFLKRKLARLRANLQSSEKEGKQGLVSMVEGRRYLRQEPGGPASSQQVLKSCLKRKASSDDDIEKMEHLNDDEDEKGNADDAEELSEDEFEELTEEDVEEYTRALETRNQSVLAAVATSVNHRNSQGWDDIMSAQQRWFYEELEYREQQEQWFFQQNLIICVLLLVLMALLEQHQQLLCA